MDSIVGEGRVWSGGGEGEEKLEAVRARKPKPQNEITPAQSFITGRINGLNRRRTARSLFVIVRAPESPPARPPGHLATFVYQKSRDLDIRPRSKGFRDLYRVPWFLVASRTVTGNAVLSPPRER